MKKVLFVCTGNYYRSRFAEIYFNHLTKDTEGALFADSRGLRVIGSKNSGPISVHAQAYLKELDLTFDPSRYPIVMDENDLITSELVIALDEHEHRPMFQIKFPDWEDKVTYWLVHDLDKTEPATALAAIKEKVERLFMKLKEE